MTRRQNRRRRYIVDPDFQYGFIRKICLLAVLIVVISLCFMALIHEKYGEVQVEIIQPAPFSSSETVETVNEAPTVSELLWPVLSISVLVTVVVTFFFGAVISHQLAGPVYRIRLELKDMAKGKLTGKLSLRKHDAFESLVVEVNAVKEEWALCMRELALIVKELEDKQCGDSIQYPRHRLDRMHQILSRYRTEAKS